MSRTGRGPGKAPGKPAYHLTDGTPVVPLYAVGEGGQASVYCLLRRNDVVKIYSDSDDVDERKLDRLISIYDNAVRGAGQLRHLCLPKDKLFDSRGRCVGYLMDYFRGTTLYESLWQTVLTERRWTRTHLVNLALAIVEALDEARYYGILIGDINLNNILVTDNGEFEIIDADSVQIGDEYVCPVHRYEFTSPRYAEALKRGEMRRTEADENYAITTLLFYILMPEKSPFMSSANLNIYQAFMRRQFVFPEGYGDVDAMARGTGRMWYDLPQPVRRAFCSVYNDSADITPDEWIRLLRDYRTALEAQIVSSVIFPRRQRFDRPLWIDCHSAPFQGLKATPDHDYSRKSINDLALVVFDLDGAFGVFHNCWERFCDHEPRIKMRRIGHDIFNRLDSEGNFDVESGGWLDSFRTELYDFVRWAGSFKPPVTRIIAVAAPAMRAIANRDEAFGAISRATGLNINMVAAPSEVDECAALAARMLDSQGVESPFVAFVDTGVWCTVLFVGADGSVVHSQVLDNCGNRMMTNRFFFMSGADRVPSEAWREHDESCRKIISGLAVPDGFAGAPLVVMGHPGFSRSATPSELERQCDEMLRIVTFNRERVSEYFTELADRDASACFHRRLSLPLVVELARRIGAGSVMAFKADIKSLVVAMVVRQIKLAARSARGISTVK